MFEAAVNHFQNEQFENALFKTTILNYAQIRQFDIDEFDDLTFLRHRRFAIFSLWETYFLLNVQIKNQPFWDMHILLKCPFWDIFTLVKCPFETCPLCYSDLFETCLLCYNALFETCSFWEMFTLIQCTFWDIPLRHNALFETCPLFYSSLLRNEQFATSNFWILIQKTATKK